MKLRIQGNSIRLRLTQSEVKDFADTGRVADQIQFGATPGETLSYMLERGHFDVPAASYAHNEIRVVIPNATGLAWATSDQVSLEHNMPLASGPLLKILVEKDFKCLTERSGEDESDNFPNPNLKC